MGFTYTPLRYPGGKTKLGPWLAELFKVNHLLDAGFAEPYAGGAGAALFLLFRGFAGRIWLNDIDPAVTSFWRAILEENERFCSSVSRVSLTVDEWRRQRDIYRSAPEGFELGFAFFYLNRTNRSGIMNGGPIGGLEQRGEWKIDARFNRQDLVERIEAIRRFRRVITVQCGDAIQFLDDLETLAGRLVVYLDPPYFGKGRALYTNFYKDEDHAEIASRLSNFRLPWVLTYDSSDEVRKFYEGSRIIESEVSYSARRVTRGREILVVSEGFRLPTIRSKKMRHTPAFRLLD